MALLLQGRNGNDLLEVYNAVFQKAKKGDSKAVDTLIKLQKEIAELANQPLPKKEKNTKDNSDEFDLS